MNVRCTVALGCSFWYAGSVLALLTLWWGCGDVSPAEQQRPVHLHGSVLHLLAAR